MFLVLSISSPKDALLMLVAMTTGHFEVSVVAKFVRSYTHYTYAEFQVIIPYFEKEAFLV